MRSRRRTHRIRRISDYQISVHTGTLQESIFDGSILMAYTLLILDANIQCRAGDISSIKDKVRRHVIIYIFSYYPDPVSHGCLIRDLHGSHAFLHLLTDIPVKFRIQDIVLIEKLRQLLVNEKFCIRIKGDIIKIRHLIQDIQIIYTQRQINTLQLLKVL